MIFPAAEVLQFVL